MPHSGHSPETLEVPGRPQSCLVQAVSPTLAVLPVPSSGGEAGFPNPHAGC